MPRPSPFLLHGWLAEWWRHYGDGAELAVARRPARRRGWSARSRSWCGAGPGLRVASFMGGRLSVLPDLLLAPDADAGDRRARCVERLAAGGCDVADFHGLPAGSRIAAALGARLDV